MFASTSRRRLLLAPRTIGASAGAIYGAASPLRLSLRPDDLRVLISPIWPAALEYAPAQTTRIVWAAEVVTAAEVAAVVTTVRAAKRPKVTAEAVIGSLKVMLIEIPVLIARPLVAA